MTFDGNVATTWGTVFADIRDKIGGMANWSVKKDQSGGAAQLSAGEWFVLTTPTGEDLRIGVSDSNVFLHTENDGFAWEYGPNFDTGSDSWSDQYANDSRALQPESLGPCDYNNLNVGDSVTYWLYYTDAEGFVVYVDRNVGDGRDADFVFGFAKLTKLWDYDTANNREGDYVMLYAGRDQGGNSTQHYMNVLGESPDTPSGQTIHATGRTNPDANYDNFPLVTQNAVASAQYSGDGDTDTIIGTHDLWTKDVSNNDSAHQDTIQSSGGTDLYTIVKAHYMDYGIKM